MKGSYFMIKVKNFLSELNENLFGDPKPSNKPHNKFLDNLITVIVIAFYMLSPLLAFYAYLNNGLF